MIYEVRTYDLKPRTLGEALKRFGDGYEHRKKYSELAACWYTEIGQLNRIVHIWPYENAGERDRIRLEANQDPHWPTPILDFLVSMQSEIFTPLPFSPELTPGNYGPIYELRSYIVKAGRMPNLVKCWEPVIEKRTELSPLLVAMQSEVGGLNKFVHIWPFSSWEQRLEIKGNKDLDGIWPPQGEGAIPVSQENMIMLPTSFSPMQ